MTGRLDRVLDGLRREVPALAAALLPGGRREGPEWVCPGDASPFGCSVSVRLHGARAGVWCAWAADKSGDIFDLVAAVRCGDDKKRALAWAEEWLRLPRAVADVPPGQSWARRDHRTVAEVDADRAAREKAALAIWLSAQASIIGTPAEDYLAARAIDLARLGRQPRALRFHPALYNGESRQKWPALVAAVQDGSGKFRAVHRTWLDPDTHGKAPLGKPKMVLGHKAGGLIALWRGSDGKPLRQAAPGSAVVISEGIEDGLTIACNAPEYRVIAAVDLGNIAALELPPAITTVILAVQNDPWWHERQERPNGTQSGLDRAIRHFQAQGRAVRLARPEGPGKDINDLARNAA